MSRGIVILLFRNATVGLDHVEKPARMVEWAEFHNGVAAGLRIAPGISKVASSKTKFNRSCDWVYPTPHKLSPFSSWTPRGSYSTIPLERSRPTPTPAS